MQKLVNYIRKYINLTKDEMYALQHSFKTRELHPNGIFFKEGQLANEIYFVLEGWIRLFYNVEVEDKTAFSRHKVSLYALAKAIIMVHLH